MWSYAHLSPCLKQPQQPQQPQPPQPPQPPQGSDRLRSCVFSCCPMDESSVQPTAGVARRRRERRLRMHWRHEQLSLRMALAAATHHSAQPRAKEGVEGETNDAPRRPKPPLPGTRPEPLEEVAEPQGLSAAPRCPDAGVPLLSVPLLAGRDGIDNTTVRWLLKLELSTQRGRGRRGGRGGRLVPPLFHAALVVDNDSGLLAMLVLLVMMHLALCSLLASPGPRCSASWPVLTEKDRCSGIFKAGFAGCNTPRAVLSFLVRRPMKLCIMAGMDQKDLFGLCKACFAGF